MTFFVLFSILWTLLLLSRGTSTGKFLYRWMVEWPAGWTISLSRGHAIVLLSFLAVISALVWFEQGEALRLMGLASPEVLGYITMFEISTFADVVAVAALTWSNLRGGVRGSNPSKVIYRIRCWFRKVPLQRVHHD
jgi:hypothetical protein